MEQEIVLFDGTMLSETASKEITEITSKIESLENQLKAFHSLQESYDEFKTALHNKMLEYGIKKYTSLSGIQFTTVASSEDKTEIVLKFNEEKFKTEEPEMYKRFVEQVEKITKGKSGYLRITLPKTEE